MVDLTPRSRGNRIELFVQTPWCMPPASVPLDLESSDEQIFRLAEAMLESAAGHMNRTDWHARMLSRMIEEGTIEQRASE